MPFNNVSGLCACACACACATAPGHRRRTGGENLKRNTPRKSNELSDGPPAEVTRCRKRGQSRNNQVFVQSLEIAWRPDAVLAEMDQPKAETLV